MCKIARLLFIKTKNGSLVTKVQILSYITDTYGKSTIKIKVPFTRYIIAINYFLVINCGDAIFRIGK